jgi:PHP family Zn ribbon phosphoesterase
MTDIVEFDLFSDNIENFETYEEPDTFDSFDLFNDFDLGSFVSCLAVSEMPRYGKSVQRYDNIPYLSWSGVHGKSGRRVFREFGEIKKTSIAIWT